MARLAVKHLVDFMLLQKDKDGSFLGNTFERQKMTERIVIAEEGYEKPRTPTDAEIVEQINKPSDLDTALDKKEKKEEPVKKSKGQLPPDEDDDPIKEEKEKFDQLEKEKKTKTKLPSREEMLNYATNILKIDLDSKINIGNKQVTIRSTYDKMTDKALYEELQMGK